MNARTLLTWLGLLVGVCALVLQFWLAIPLYLSKGKDLPGALGTFFAFYTILTNITLVLIYSSAIWSGRPMSLFRHPTVRAMMAANITLVFLFVYFVLSKTYAFSGLSLLVDNLLHYVTPVIYVLWWLTTQKHGQLRWESLPAMLAPTLVYFLAILARGVWVNEYPYPILDVTTLGYGAVWINAVVMTVALGALCLIVIALDRALARSPRTAP
ncbi:Pr6Pr family membrane protein [Devosia algicola]|uniref:Pr6Pr family membrane protein n=1 Tax=Devosia algicola TaxID=3026418 RepID=A0ABY7YQV5_9HYPH|nr:Pr6Pr family membrane protein [Devosia algicola]WDR03713.1 Pr6Pr family membrane protein [Devosia algicola]